MQQAPKCKERRYCPLSSKCTMPEGIEGLRTLAERCHMSGTTREETPLFHFILDLRKANGLIAK